MKTFQDILKPRDLSATFRPLMDISGGTFPASDGTARCADNQRGPELEVEMVRRHVLREFFAAQNYV